MCIAMKWGTISNIFFEKLSFGIKIHRSCAQDYINANAYSNADTNMSESNEEEAYDAIEEIKIEIFGLLVDKTQATPEKNSLRVEKSNTKNDMITVSNNKNYVTSNNKDILAHNENTLNNRKELMFTLK